MANYYPVHNPNVYRWSAIAEHWVAQGHEVNVLTTIHQNSEQEEQLNGVNIYRRGFATLKDYHHKLTNTSISRNIPDLNQEDKTSAFSEKIVDLSWRKFYWPDGSRLFLKPGIKLGKKILATQNHDLMISVGLPYTCHLIARKLKQAFSNIKWHMDIEDPFCYSNEFWVNNFAIYRLKNIKEEEKAFQQADSISVTNENARLEYRAFFPDELHKVCVIPPILDYDDTGSAPVNFDEKKINFAYFGVFYDKVRSPESFLKFLSYIRAHHTQWLEDKCFHFFGQQNRFSKAFFEAFWELEDVIKLHGLIERQNVWDQTTKVDFLINFGNTTSYHLPSKSVEYLASKKPIINIKQNANDSFEKFSKSISGILHFNLNDKHSFSEQFDILHQFVNKKHKVNNFDSKAYLVGSIADLYLQR